MWQKPRVNRLIKICNWFVVVSCIFFSGCVQRNANQTRRQARDSVESVRACEAKLLDIPTPLNVQRIAGDGSDTASMLRYSSSESVSELISFYLVEMERFGWQTLSTFNGEDVHLIFDKPDRICTVTMQSSRKGLLDIRVFVGKKEKSVS